MKKTKSSVPTTLGYAILGLLKDKQLSGYGVRKIFETTPMGIYSSGPGTIYPALHRLERLGLIRQVVLVSENKKEKKPFQITATGKRFLRTWLKQPVQPEDVSKRLMELLLRFAFMDDSISFEHRIQFLESCRCETHRYIQVLKEYLEPLHASKSPHGWLAIEHGIESYKTTARWADHAIKVLRKQKEKYEATSKTAKTPSN